MTDKLPDHELIERVFRTHPNELLSRFKDQESIEVKRARENLKIAEQYVHEAREKGSST